MFLICIGEVSRNLMTDLRLGRLSLQLNMANTTEKAPIFFRSLAGKMLAHHTIRLNKELFMSQQQKGGSDQKSGERNQTGQGSQGKQSQQTHPNSGQTGTERGGNSEQNRKAGQQSRKNS